MATAKVFLNKGYEKKNGECSVYLLVHIDYKSLKFPTGVSCLPDRFNDKTFRIKGNSKKVRDNNLIIEKALAQMNDIFVRYRLQQVHLTPELLKNEWKNPSRRIDFYAFFEEAINERRDEIRKQTWKNHWSEVNKLKQFKPSLAFSEFTADMIEQYKRWLKTEKKNDINSIHTSMKVLKTYINIAIKKGVISDNPFALVKVKQAKPDRVFLTVEELEKIWNLYNENVLKLTEQSVLRHFLFMCFSGVRISDFKNLYEFNVHSNLLIYHPEKTSGIKKIPVKVPLTKYALQLINDENSTTGRLFNPISEQKMNEYIKRIVKKVGIYKPLSNHSARHTFATTWLEKTHDLAALKELLGHSKISDTMTYVHITDGMLKEQMANYEKNLFNKPITKHPASNEAG